jgi:pimeloyl-ACP methyl ester carboxylesterase
VPTFTRPTVTLDYDIRGPADGLPLLLIMGLGMQRLGWPDSFLDALVARGFRVVTFDNRDVGLSTRYEEHPAPGVAGMLAARVLGGGSALPYRLSDMADDAAALLDHLGIERAHVAGISMGGMIATHLAARHPARVLSLTLMATSSGRLGLPPPRPRVLQAAFTRPAPGAGSDAAVEYSVRMFTILGGSVYPTGADTIRERARRQATRAPRGTGINRQMAAIAADGDRSALLRRLRLPVLILHGSDDPMVPPAHARQLARLIPHARLELIEGWGHDLPDALAPRFAESIRELAATARGS